MQLEMERIEEANRIKEEAKWNCTNNGTNCTDDEDEHNEIMPKDRQHVNDMKKEKYKEAFFLTNSLESIKSEKISKELQRNKLKKFIKNCTKKIDLLDDRIDDGTKRVRALYDEVKQLNVTVDEERAYQAKL